MVLIPIMVLCLSTTIASVDGQSSVIRRGDQINPTGLMGKEIPEVNNRAEESICRLDSPCPCRVHTRIVLKDGERIQFTDYRCVSEDSPYEGLRCVQLESQQKCCHDYTGRSLNKSVVVDRQYGCELRHDSFYRNDRSEVDHHHQQHRRRHHHHQQQNQQQHHRHHGRKHHHHHDY